MYCIVFVGYRSLILFSDAVKHDKHLACTRSFTSKCGEYVRNTFHNASGKWGLGFGVWQSRTKRPTAYKSRFIFFHFPQKL